MVRPARDAFRELARRGRAVPLVREVLADLDTPLTAFLKVDDGETAFLLESSEDAGEGAMDWGRFSIIGIGARARFESKDGRVRISRGGRSEEISLDAERREDPLEHLRSLLAELRPLDIEGVGRFAGGAVGYVAYDWVRYVERLPDKNPDTLGVADCLFTFPEVVLVHDRVQQLFQILCAVEIEPGADVDAAYDAGLARIEAVERKLRQAVPAQPLGRGEPAKLAYRSNTTREGYHEMVERSRAYIREGDIFQVVPSQRLELDLEVDPFQVYRQLRVLNPSPYLFFLRCGDHVVLGSSPEILVRLEDGRIALRPIAGTAPRGATPEEDREIERRLLSDPKELAEHLMLVDLGRNDVGRVAEIGSVEMDEFQVIERYSHVMHIVSNVRGRLRADCDAIDLLRATFPAGTLSGAPKVRAMEIIDELETERRGLYGGSVGYIDYRGNMDMCIAIRSVFVRGRKAWLQAGGGVVADSDPETEYQESLNKAGAPLRAIALATGSREP